MFKIEIRAAEGGDDAKLLVSDLFKAYEKAERL
jgi:protein subunit release factor A